MKFDPQNWRPFKSKFVSTRQDVHVKLSEPGALYCIEGKQKILVGYGTEFKFHTSEGMLDFEATKPGVQFFATETLVKPVGVPFTNAEKQSISAVEAAVTVALRELKRKEKAFAKKQKAAFDEMQRKRKAEGLQDEAPEVEEEVPAPDGITEPAQPAAE